MRAFDNRTGSYPARYPTNRPAFVVMFTKTLPKGVMESLATDFFINR